LLVELLLCNDGERAFSGQWLRKHAPVARQQILNNATVGLEHCKIVFVLVSNIILRYNLENDEIN
jgi:hypothetical protein